MRKCEAMLAAPLDLLKDEREQCSDNMNFGHSRAEAASMV